MPRSKFGTMFGNGTPVGLWFESHQSLVQFISDCIAVPLPLFAVLTCLVYPETAVPYTATPTNSDDFTTLSSRTRGIEEISSEERGTHGHVRTHRVQVGPSIIVGVPYASRLSSGASHACWTLRCPHSLRVILVAALLYTSVLQRFPALFATLILYPRVAT
ncbi:hypothetical protein NMY22_g16484 [Coprinellus aureogranulatus]|nr:hypothetical protein NMY22_g16484 [Coprinellus aureogranulatus]